MMKKILSLFLILTFTVSPVFHAQTADSEDGDPYTKEEFPLWLKDLRRFEVITVGVFPIAILLSSTGHSLYKSLFGTSDTEQAGAISFNTSFTTEEKYGIVYTGLIASLCFAALDFLIGKIRASKTTK